MYKFTRTRTCSSVLQCWRHIHTKHNQTQGCMHVINLTLIMCLSEPVSFVSVREHVILNQNKRPLFAQVSLGGSCPLHSGAESQIQVRVWIWCDSKLWFSLCSANHCLFKSIQVSYQVLKRINLLHISFIFICGWRWLSTIQELWLSVLAGWLRNSRGDSQW